MRIRSARLKDLDGIHATHLSAFGEDEAELVAQLAVDLLQVQSEPVTFSLVAEDDGEVWGHVCFSPIETGDDEKVGYTLAPLGVRAGAQKRGIGSALVREGIKRVTDLGAAFVMVYGDPRYYCRFGFDVEVAKFLLPPYPLQYPHGWQAMLIGDAEPFLHPVKISCVAPLCDPRLW